VEWIPNALTVIGELFGLTGLILILATCMIVAAIYYNRKNGVDPVKAISDVVTPVTCQWSEFDRTSLRETMRKQDELHEDVKQANRRLERLEIESARMQGYFNR
jgi:hypothetical protein